MSEDNKPKVQKVDFDAPMSMETLMKMFIKAQQDQADSNRELAQSIRDQKIPYVDPKVVAEREQRRKDREMLINQEMQKRSLARRMCPHINEGGKLNIKWMEHSNGIILGTCGACQSVFDASHNPEDAKLLRGDPRALRNMGRAGVHARRGSVIAG